jgi:integrase
MALVLKRLERAHRDGTWPALALTVPFTYDWFHSVQRYMNTFTASEHTLHAAMSACFTIVQERSRCAPTVSWQTILEQVTQTKRNSCPRSLAQVVRRLYMVANVVWYEFLKEWLHPLRPPRLPWSLRRSPDDVPTRVFTDAEVQRIVDVAPAVSPYAEALVRLLFSTGLRIGAVARLRWENILVDGSPPHIATVIEKGRRVRAFLLRQDVQTALKRMSPRKPDPHRVFPVSSRQLRNIFYNACKVAGLRGAHCHPHNARHTLVHNLFAAGNSVALIAKFLGHGTIQTTERYYLRLSFEETMRRMHLPWGGSVNAPNPGCCNKDETDHPDATAHA